LPVLLGEGLVGYDRSVDAIDLAVGIAVGSIGSASRSVRPALRPAPGEGQA